MSEQLAYVPRTEKLSKSGLANWRKEGKIPATLYGKTLASTPIFLDTKKMNLPMGQIHKGSVFWFEFNNKKFNATIEEVQKDPTTSTITHLSFHVVSNSEETQVSIPIVTHGRAEGEKQGGVVVVVKHAIYVKGLIQNIPEQILVDISKLQLNQKMTIADISLPKNVTLREKNLGEAIIVCKAVKEEVVAAPEAATDSIETPST